MTKSKLEDEMVGLLGGRVSEKLIIGDITTGAQNDIQRATAIARKMVTEYGMSNDIGPIAFGTGHDEVFIGRDLGRSRNFSEEIASKIDNEIKRLIDESYMKAERILTEKIDKLHEVAKVLMEKEKLYEDEFNAIIEGKATAEDFISSDATNDKQELDNDKQENVEKVNKVNKDNQDTDEN